MSRLGRTSDSPNVFIQFWHKSKSPFWDLIQLRACEDGYFRRLSQEQDNNIDDFDIEK